MTGQQSFGQQSYGQQALQGAGATGLQTAGAIPLNTQGFGQQASFGQQGGVQAFQGGAQTSYMRPQGQAGKVYGQGQTGMAYQGQAGQNSYKPASSSVSELFLLVVLSVHVPF